MYSATLMPYGISFLEINSSTRYKWNFVDYFVDLIFFIDLVINFNLAFYDNKENLIVSRKVFIN